MSIDGIFGGLMWACGSIIVGCCLRVWWWFMDMIVVRCERGGLVEVYARTFWSSKILNLFIYYQKQNIYFFFC